MATSVKGNISMAEPGNHLAWSSRVEFFLAYFIFWFMSYQRNFLHIFVIAFLATLAGRGNIVIWHPQLVGRYSRILKYIC